MRKRRESSRQPAPLRIVAQSSPVMLLSSSEVCAAVEERSGTCLCVNTSQCIPLCSRAQVLDVVVALRRSIVEALLRRVVVVRRASEHGSRQHSSSDGASLKRH